MRWQALKRSRCALPFALALAVGGASGQVLAQNDDAELAALRTQLEQIRTLVVSFDERLKALELARQAAVRAAPIAPSAAELLPVAAGAGQLPAAEPFRTAQPPAATRDHAQTGQTARPATAAPDRQAWRQLGSGATQDEVTRLLGAPTKTFQLAGRRCGTTIIPRREPVLYFSTRPAARRACRVRRAAGRKRRPARHLRPPGPPEPVVGLEPRNLARPGTIA